MYQVPAGTGLYVLVAAGVYQVISATRTELPDLESEREDV